jgi:hypothetical protein
MDSAQTLITEAQGLQGIGGELEALQVMVMLLAKYAGPPYSTMTGTQLTLAASPYQACAGRLEALQVIIYLLDKLVNGGGSSGGGGGIQSGNYGGGQPNFTPASGTGAAIDTSDGELWFYYNGGWADSGVTL